MTVTNVFITAALMLLTGMVVPASAADAWPARPIRLIAPFPAGSTVDAAASRAESQSQAGMSMIALSR